MHYEVVYVNLRGLGWCVPVFTCFTFTILAAAIQMAIPIYISARRPGAYLDASLNPRWALP
jgi:hypothetical protein